MSRFLNIIHKRAHSEAKLGEEQGEETSKYIPEEKFRDEDLVFVDFFMAKPNKSDERTCCRNWKCF